MLRWLPVQHPVPNHLLLTSINPPPHFQLFRSLRTWNFPLAGLTATILLSNVLAVALVGLFSATTGKFHDRIPVATYAFPTLLKNFSTPASVRYFLLDESLSNDRTRSKTLTWTTDWYYIVGQLPSAAPPGLEEYNVTTLGIGVDIQCTPVAADKITLTCDLPSKLNTCRTAGDQFSDINHIRIDNPCWPNGRYVY